MTPEPGPTPDPEPTPMISFLSPAKAYNFFSTPYHGYDTLKYNDVNYRIEFGHTGSATRYTGIFMIPDSINDGGAHNTVISARQDYPEWSSGTGAVIEGFKLAYDTDEHNFVQDSSVVIYVTTLDALVDDNTAYLANLILNATSVLVQTPGLSS